METKLSRSAPSIVVLVVIWAVYTVVYSLLKAGESTKWLAGILEIVGESGLNAAIALLAIWLWRNADKSSKRIFGFFAFSFSFVTLSSIIYHVIFNVLHLSIPYFSTVGGIIITHHVPYVLCLLFEFLAWLAIVSQMKKNTGNVFAYLPLAIVLVIVSAVFIFMFNAKIGNGLSVFANLYSITISTFYFINFILAFICLATSKNKGIFYFSLGYLLVISADLIMDFGIFKQSFGIGSIMETIWILAQLLMLSGFFIFKKTGTYKIAPSNWIAEADSLKAQSTFWCCIVSAISCATLWGVTHVFSSGVFF